MAITTLDKTTALVVIDLQKGITGLPGVNNIKDVVSNSALLADAFRRNKLPVVLVNVTGMAPGRSEQQPRLGELPPDWTVLVPELNQQPEDHCVSKRTWGAFASTEIEKYLRDKGVTQIVLCGVATSIGVESTARQAYEAGFNVSLAIDAMTDLHPEAHENSIKRIFPRLGETGTTKEIIEQLSVKGAAVK